MDKRDGSAGRFDAGRGGPHAVASRMLGPLTGAGDGAQEAWLLGRRAPAAPSGGSTEAAV